MSSISQRKTDHLDLTIQANVGFRQTTTLFECVRLVHDALPDLDFETLDTSVEILGKRWDRNGDAIRHQIGISLQETEFSDKLTVLVSRNL